MGLQEVLVLLARLVIASSVTLFEDEPIEDHRKKVDTTHIHLPNVKLLSKQYVIAIFANRSKINLKHIDELQRGYIINVNIIIGMAL